MLLNAARIEAVIALLSAGADPNGFDLLDGFAPVCLRRFSVVVVALSAFCVACQLIVTDMGGQLHFAAHTDFMPAISLLIQAGANVNLGNKHCFTPLHCAAAGKYVALTCSLNFVADMRAAH